MTKKDRNPLLGWTLDRSRIRNVGVGLQRPECILAERDGTLWTAEARGGVMRIAADGSQTLIAQRIFDRHFHGGTMTPEVMARCEGTLAPWMASVTFGGPDLRTVYLGSLMGNTLPALQVPVTGLPLSHWNP